MKPGSAEMDTVFLLDKEKVRSELSRFVDYASSLTAPEELAKAIQAWETIRSVAEATEILAQANHRLGLIYWEWDEFAPAFRFLEAAYRLNENDSRVESTLQEFRHAISDNQSSQIADEIARKNSDLIVSLFRIATGLKLIQMDKPTQAYPLMRSRTKIYPNAAVAKHLLMEILITEDEKNSAIRFLEENGWLEERAHERYTLTDAGLYAFYTELGTLHTSNNAHDEAAACYEQAYWLNNASDDLLYKKFICDVNAENWEAALGLMPRLDVNAPEAIDVLDYNRAVAVACSHAYRTEKDSALGKRAINACEAVLKTNKKDREISDLLKSLQADTRLQPEEAASTKKRWWQRKTGIRG